MINYKWWSFGVNFTSLSHFENTQTKWKLQNTTHKYIWSNQFLQLSSLAHTYCEKCWPNQTKSMCLCCFHFIRRFASWIRWTFPNSMYFYNSLKFFNFSLGFWWVCAFAYTNARAHTYTRPKLFNLWTCFAKDANGSMQVVNVLLFMPYVVRW